MSVAKLKQKLNRAVSLNFKNIESYTNYNRTFRDGNYYFSVIVKNKK
jgi:hypothetical protein